MILVGVRVIMVVGMCLKYLNYCHLLIWMNKVLKMKIFFIVHLVLMLICCIKINTENCTLIIYLLVVASIYPSLEPSTYTLSFNFHKSGNSSGPRNIIPYGMPNFTADVDISSSLD